MRVSVVLCTHSLERYDAFTEAAQSVLEQTHDDVELVVVVDGNEAVYERVVGDYGGQDDVVLHCNEENVGLAASRNRGAELATGEVVAFIDDDAVAAPDWIETLVSVYESRDVLAAGGKMTPEWVAGRPEFLPEEFYWLVGVTHRGFADGPGEVRNTFGSNISFRRDVFLELDGFSTEGVGLKGSKQLQAEEPEFCARLRREYGSGVYYEPEARVAHKVFQYRTEPRWLLRRAFWQGYSKRLMERLAGESGGEESAYLGRLLGEYVPERLANLLADPDTVQFKQFATLLGLTGVTGLGYGYGILSQLVGRNP